MQTFTAIVALSAVRLALCNPLIPRQGNTDAGTMLMTYASGDCQGAVLQTETITSDNPCFAFSQQGASLFITSFLNEGAPAGRYNISTEPWSDLVCTVQGQPGRVLPVDDSYCYNGVVNAATVSVAFTPQ